jgi:hypothetical protein
VQSACGTAAHQDSLNVIVIPRSVGLSVADIRGSIRSRRRLLWQRYLWAKLLLLGLGLLLCALWLLTLLVLLLLLLLLLLAHAVLDSADGSGSTIAILGLQLLLRPTSRHAVIVVDVVSLVRRHGRGWLGAWFLLDSCARF